MGNKTTGHRDVEGIEKVYPTLFKNAGPGCLNGPCPEGKMTCGKIVEVREKFKMQNQ